jgi:hypothetical protein
MKTTKMKHPYYVAIQKAMEIHMVKNRQQILDKTIIII